MTLFELFILSAALGTDLFSVAVPIGMNKVRRRVIVSSAAVFALFHVIMILAGYYLGHWLGLAVEHVGAYHINSLELAVQNWAQIFGALVLIGLGIHMIRECLKEDEPDIVQGHPLKGLSLAMIAAGVSVDAFAAGFSLGMMDVDLVKLSIILSGVIFCIAVTGLGLGRKLGRFIGDRAAIFGGAVLILLGGHLMWTTIF